jgi:hypothetical protein
LSLTLNRSFSISLKVFTAILGYFSLLYGSFFVSRAFDCELAGAI